MNCVNCVQGNIANSERHSHCGGSGEEREGELPDRPVMWPVREIPQLARTFPNVIHRGSHFLSSRHPPRIRLQWSVHSTNRVHYEAAQRPVFNPTTEQMERIRSHNGRPSTHRFRSGLSVANI
jgi:hypothetical protein